MSAIPQSIAYKESGIPWVGKIPEHWGTIKVNKISNMINGYAFDSNDFNFSFNIPVIRIGDIQNNSVLIEECLKTKERSELKQFLVKKGDILVALSGATVGKVGFYANENMAYINQRVAIFRGQSNNFLKFCFLMRGFINFIFLLCNGSAQPNISTKDIGDFKIPLPPLKEQKAIADFLDKKTCQIEEFITKKQKLITLLEEKKQTLINQCVTQGLDPSTPLKDSGVEWLGKIPTHWEVKKLKLLFGIGSGLGITKADFVPSGIPCVSYGEIHSKYPCRLNTGIHPLPYVSEDYLSSKPQALLKKGDFVFADTSEDIEGSGNFTSLQSDDPVFAGYHTIVLKPKTQSIHSPYFSFLFDSLGIRNQVRKEVCGVKVYSITKSILKEVQCLIPPLEEQKAIAEYLDTQIEKIDLAICKIKSQINLIKEYKTTLISEAVCGRIGVEGNV